jgi:hypothetical protein
MPSRTLAQRYVEEGLRMDEHPLVRFDIPVHQGKPRFRLIYRNEPSDSAPAESRWLAVAPRAGLRAHRRASQRSRQAS